MVRITTTLPALLASLLHLAQAGPVADAAITPLASLQERDGTCQPVRSTSFPPCTSGVPSVPDSDQNCNPVKSGVYNIAGDPKYTFTEDVYRKAIYLPSSFSTSKKAVILFGGTGLPTYWTYKDTLIARLQADGLNPVWVNVPYSLQKWQTQDAQVTAEFAAYAINYMKALTGQPVAIAGASQGTVNVQWALKYWPSTNANTASFIALSPIFHGKPSSAKNVSTVSLIKITGTNKYDFFIPAVYATGSGLPPASWQQDDYAQYIKALLNQQSYNSRSNSNNNGNGPIVPTTSIWSNQDEVVSPNDGGSASEQLGFFTPTNNFVAVEVQNVCNQFAGASNYPSSGGSQFTYTHVGLLLHPIVYAVFKSAVQNNGVTSYDFNFLQNVIKPLCQQSLSYDPAYASSPSAIAAPSSLVSLASCSASAGYYNPTVKAEPPLKCYATATAANC